MSLLLNELLFSNQEFIKDCYQCNSPHSCSDYFDLVTAPFKLLKLKNVFLSSDFKKELLEALNCLELLRKDNDLYGLWQSEELLNSENKAITKFVNILEEKIKPLLSNICSIQLTKKLTITASLYNYGDVLLCHDDKCGDRCIAFVYYLTGSSDSGGTFDMFSHDESGQPTEIAYSIPPEEDSFVFFEVGDLTYHQVSEVTDPKFKRWSINGWFHSDRKLSELNYEDPMPSLLDQIPHEGLFFLDQYLNLIYCTPSNLLQMRDQFENESFILLKDFLCKDMFESCSEELSCNNLVWKKVGPAIRRNFFEADLTELPVTLNSLVKLLKSPLLMSFLKNITSLSLEPTNGISGSQFLLSLIKWEAGCYTMVTDNDSFFKKPGLDLFFFFQTGSLVSAENSSGYITYLDTSTDDDDHELLSIIPEDNALALVYRADHTVRFTKFINSSVTKPYYGVYATFYEVENGEKC